MLSASDSDFGVSIKIAWFTNNAGNHSDNEGVGWGADQKVDPVTAPRDFFTFIAWFVRRIWVRCCCLHSSDDRTEKKEMKSTRHKHTRMEILNVPSFSAASSGPMKTRANMSDVIQFCFSKKFMCFASSSLGIRRRPCLRLCLCCSPCQTIHHAHARTFCALSAVSPRTVFV